MFQVKDYLFLCECVYKPTFSDIIQFSLVKSYMYRLKNKAVQSSVPARNLGTQAASHASMLDSGGRGRFPFAQTCRNCVRLSCQYGSKCQRNFSSILLSLSHKEPSTRKVLKKQSVSVYFHRTFLCCFYTNGEKEK